MSKALVEGEDYYLTPEGRFVFTAAYLQRRGHCCGSGCRHCPYPQDNTEIKESAPSSGRKARYRLAWWLADAP